MALVLTSLSPHAARSPNAFERPPLARHRSLGNRRNDLRATSYPDRIDKYEQRVRGVQRGVKDLRRSGPPLSRDPDTVPGEPNLLARRPVRSLLAFAVLRMHV